MKNYTSIWKTTVTHVDIDSGEFITPRDKKLYDVVQTKTDIDKSLFLKKITKLCRKKRWKQLNLFQETKKC